MIDHILDRYADVAGTTVIVVNPADRSMVERHLRDRNPTVRLVEQAAPTGMLDAILLAADAVRAASPDRVWVTWCDQVGISADTVARLDAMDTASPDHEVIFPTAQQPSPYIHFERDADGRPTGVRQRREHDQMPAIGTSDAGLFSLSPYVFEKWLPEYANAATLGTGSGERNFLPFLPWMATRGQVSTFEIDVSEAQGINTPGDLAEVEQRLRAAPGTAS